MNSKPKKKTELLPRRRVLILLFLLTILGVRAQVAVDPRTEEYATVRAVISQETGGFSAKATTPNPFLEIEGMAMELKDYVRDSKGAKFDSVTDMINYMNKFSWTLATV